MIPFNCMHCYLAFSCHALPKRSHASPCPSHPPSGTRPLSSLGAVRACNGLGPAGYGEEYTARQAAPHSNLLRSLLTLSPLCHLHPSAGSESSHYPGCSYCSKCCGHEQIQPWVTSVLLHTRPLCWN